MFDLERVPFSALSRFPMFRDLGAHGGRSMACHSVLDAFFVTCWWAASAAGNSGRVDDETGGLGVDRRPGSSQHPVQRFDEGRSRSRSGSAAGAGGRGRRSRIVERLRSSARAESRWD